MRDRIVVFGIDNTITDADWRRQVGSYDESQLLAAEDKPMKDVIEVINSLLAYHVVGIAARPERFRKLTMDWLLSHRVNIDTLIMRNDADFRPEPLVKIELLKSKFGLSRIVCAFDARDDVIEAYRDAGLTAFQVFHRKVI